MRRAAPPPAGKNTQNWVIFRAAHFLEHFIQRVSKVSQNGTVFALYQRTGKKMKNSICLSLIIFAILVGGTSAALAQSGGSSVMIYNKAKPGTEDNSVGNAFEQALIKGL